METYNQSEVGDVHFPAVVFSIRGVLATGPYCADPLPDSVASSVAISCGGNRRARSAGTRARSDHASGAFIGIAFSGVNRPKTARRFLFRQPPSTTLP